MFLGMLSIEPTQQAVQIDLAIGAGKLGLTELGVGLLAGATWPAGNGIEPVAARDVKSLSLRGLLGASGTTLIGPKGDALLHGINLMSRGLLGYLPLWGSRRRCPGPCRPIIWSWRAAIAGDLAFMIGLTVAVVGVIYEH